MTMENEQTPTEHLRDYIQNTPSEELKKDWEEIEKLGIEGPTLEEVLAIPSPDNSVEAPHLPLGHIRHIGYAAHGRATLGAALMLMLAGQSLIRPPESDDEREERLMAERNRLSGVDIIVVGSDRYMDELVLDSLRAKGVTVAQITENRAQELFPNEDINTWGNVQKVIPIQIAAREYFDGLEFNCTSYDEAAKYQDRDKKQRQKAHTWGKKSNRKGGWLS